jgi:ABC-type branched-subunit amino acid transport system substrate-binding protein
VIGAAAALCAAGPAWAGKAAAKGEPIVIGQSAALSGPASELGLQFRLGAQLLFDRVNAQGGVAGRALELHSLDDGYDPKRCVQNTRHLIDEGAVTLFGYVGTATSLAVLPMVSEAKRIFFAPFTGSEALRIPFNPLAFHLRASYVDETKAIVKHLTSVGIQRIGVFYQNDGDGKAGLLGVARALKLQYQSPTGLGFVERNSADVDTAVKNILAAKPDAIVQITPYRASAAFVRAARRAGYGGVFYNTSLVGAQALADELGADAHGVVVSQVMPFPFAPKTRIAGEYLDAGERSQGPSFKPSYGSIEGYVAAKTLVEGLRRASALTPAGIGSALETLRNLDLGGFVVDFGPNQHAGSKFIELTILSEKGKVRY